MRRLTTCTALQGWTGAAAIGVVAATAPADITIAEWTDDEHFEFNVNYMPDLDQRRTSLPGVGSAFCVPTATMNLFSYAAEWGFDDLEPGPGVWQGDVSYGIMTGHLATLGGFMNTGTSGTSISGWYAGMDAWLEGFPFTYQAIYKTDDWCPTLSDAALAAAFGGIVNVCYGRYNFNPSPEPILGARVSGHCVTVARALADGPGVLELWVRDPANDADVFSEAPWAYSIFGVETMSVRQDWDNDAGYLPTQATVINYDPNGTLIRLIDSLMVMYPTTGYSWSAVQLNVAPIAGSFGVAPSQTFVMTPGFNLVDVAQASDARYYYTLVNEGPVTFLMRADPITGNMNIVTNIDGATDLAVGRHGDVYVLGDMQVYRLDGQGQIVSVAPLPFEAQAIAYRDTTDEVVLVSTLLQKLVIYPRSLATGTLYSIPAPVATECIIAVRESDGAVGMVVPGDDVVFTYRVTNQGVVESDSFEPVTPTALDAAGLAFADGGHLLVTTGLGSVLEFAPAPACWWCWSPVSPSMYDGVQTPGSFRVSRSRTNFDPVLNAVDNVHAPAETLEYFGQVVYDCPGDFDNDQIVGVVDLLALLAIWGVSCPGCPEDLQPDGIISVTDLLVLLTVWGACGP